MANQTHGSGKVGPFLDFAVARARVISAVNELFQKDCELFLVDAGERTIAHKFAEYLTPLVPEFHVDCEYNRDGHTMNESDGAPSKMAMLFEKKGIQRVYPDVIVHRRRQAVNALVAELKRSCNPQGRAEDDAKLRYFTAEFVPDLSTAYEYDVGVFLEFYTGPEIWTTKELRADATWYLKGDCHSSETLVTMNYPNPDW